MNAIEKKIHEHFASMTEKNLDFASGSTPQPSENRSLASRPAALDLPFAKVNTVVPGSPAESAGLTAGDEIRNFGYVNRSNNDGLRRVADCVQGNEGVSHLPIRPVLSLFPLFSSSVQSGFESWFPELRR